MPNIASILGARINGLYFDFSSIELLIDGVGVQANVSEINYSTKMDPGIFRGTSAMPRGRTRGPVDHEADFTIYKEDFELIKSKLAALGHGGFMMAAFVITVMYRELETATVQDTIQGARIISIENSHSQGNEPLVVKAQLSVMNILYNNFSAVDTKPGGAIGGAIGGAVGGLLGG